MNTEVRDILSEKVSGPIAVTPSGILNETRSIQSAKAIASIVVTEFGMVIEVSPVFQNDPWPMVFNVLGNTADFKFTHIKQQCFSSSVTPSGMIK